MMIYMGSGERNIDYFGKGERYRFFDTSNLSNSYLGKYKYYS